MKFLLFVAIYVVVILADIYTIIFFLKNTKHTSVFRKIICILLMLTGIFSVDYVFSTDMYLFQQNGFGGNFGYLANYADKSLVTLKLSFPIGLIVFWWYHFISKQEKSYR